MIAGPRFLSVGVIIRFFWLSTVLVRWLGWVLGCLISFFLFRQEAFVFAFEFFFKLGDFFFNLKWC